MVSSDPSTARIEQKIIKDLLVRLDIELRGSGCLLGDRLRLLAIIAVIVVVIVVVVVVIITSIAVAGIAALVLSGSSDGAALAPPPRWQQRCSRRHPRRGHLLRRPRLPPSAPRFLPRPSVL